VVLRFNYIAVILVWYEGLLVVTVFVYLVVLWTHSKCLSLQRNWWTSNWYCI